MDARIAPPFMEATDASRLVCVVVVSYQEYSLTHVNKHAERISLSVVRGVNRAIRSHLATLSARLARA